MTFRPDLLLAHDFGERRHRYEARDAILYALGVGIGHDPLDADALALVDETRLEVLPTFAVTLGSPGMWIRDPAFGVDFGKLVHSAQEARFLSPLPAAGEVVSTARVLSLEDRGEGRGAVLKLGRRISDASTGRDLCMLTQTLLLRGNGGFGGPSAAREPPIIPANAPARTIEVVLSRRAALIYRLSGDWNPLHIDPGTARSAGFDQPIMHGLGTYGTAGAAIARALDRSPIWMTALSCRFTGVVLPGDTLAIDLWPDAEGATFRARVGERVVLDDGVVRFGEAA